jgi:small subunit ribosomal protein S16
MAVKIRLKRIGAKNHPVYRVVVADGRSPRDGRFIEELGTYDPQKQTLENYTLNYERTQYWLSKGAQPSETAASIIKRASKSQPVVAATAPVATAPVAVD